MLGTPFELRPEMFQQTLSAQEIALREAFVQSYMQDYDPFMACIRIGFLPQFAQESSRILYTDTYVQSRLAYLFQNKIPELTPEQQLEQDKNLIRNGLRQAITHGPYSSRVAAALALARVLGIDKQTKDDEDGQLIEAFKNFASQAPV